MFVEWQGTGPSEEQENTQFLCTVDDQVSEACKSRNTGLTDLHYWALEHLTNVGAIVVSD